MTCAPREIARNRAEFRSDMMVVRKDADGRRRYFRADSDKREEYSYQRPFILELEITRRCNLQCVHCYAESENKTFENELTFDEITEILTSARNIGIPELSLTGGEVMMRPDFLRIIDAGFRHGFDVRFVTNVTLLNDGLFTELTRRPIKLITVSLDAMNSDTHEAIRGKSSHTPAIDGILRLKAAGFHLSIITAFSKLNISDFDDLYEFCKKHDIPWQVQLTSAKGRCGKDITLSPEEYYNLGEKVAKIMTSSSNTITIIPMDDLATFSHFPPLNRLSQTWQGMCTGGLLNLFVRANGDVTPCSALCFDKCIVGNIRTDSLETICREERCKTALSPFSAESRTGACRACPYLDACNGGCPEILLSMSRTSTENDYCYHKIEQDRILKALYP
ncbi:MAG: radical SAM protein [Deltaproteobacteria bacterium]|nr:radical SAM protein [Deltaproteobacteria bacterium]MBN2670130.1 radical SAM protein [Deltaproteobacteria bacterium]